MDEGWLDQRLAAARNRPHEIVRLPYSVGMFWGCTCPMDYLCVSSVEPFATIFTSEARVASVDLRRGVVPDPMRPVETGTQVGVVEGWLEPDRQKEWMGEGGEHKLWSELVFTVWHARAFASDAEGSSQDASVVAELDDDELSVPRLHDERRWLAIVATLPYQQPRVDDEAKALQARAIAAGFADAEVIDTRQTDELFCCSRVVLAGRYAGKKEADAVIGRAKRAGLAAYVRKGW
jgi:hypothetical protein